MKRGWLCIWLFGFSHFAFSADFDATKVDSTETDSTESTINDARALFHYQMFCQGCHSPDAMGVREVPRINNFMGNFLKVEGGREYLVQVPGSANAALSDDHLAELLNWIILKFGGDSIPQDFSHYTGTEVGELRKNPLLETVNKRAELVDLMEQK